MGRSIIWDVAARIQFTDGTSRKRQCEAIFCYARVRSAGFMAVTHPGVHMGS